MISRTTNPLHFEDLEPHRFEDLIRTLFIKFRKWRTFEATGRLGNDEGYDIRGFEIVEPRVDDKLINRGALNPHETAHIQDRLWQIQCKREKTIGPKKMDKYLSDLLTNQSNLPFGFIFVASCDFSLDTRNKFKEKLTQIGIKVFYLLGKAEIEDLLIQPENDNILSNFFGYSLISKSSTDENRLFSGYSSNFPIGPNEMEGILEFNLIPWDLPEKLAFNIQIIVSNINKDVPIIKPIIKLYQNHGIGKVIDNISSLHFGDPIDEFYYYSFKNRNHSGYALTYTYQIVFYGDNCRPRNTYYMVTVYYEPNIKITKENQSLHPLYRLEVETFALNELYTKGNF